jgi:hypothetical protein
MRSSHANKVGNQSHMVSREAPIGKTYMYMKNIQGM